MASNSIKKPLSARLINAMKPDAKLIDSGENTGLNVSCNKSGVKTFFYRYRSPHHNRVKRVTLGVYVSEVRNELLDAPLGQKMLGLSSARQILVGLKAERKAGICPSERLKEEAKLKETARKLVEKDKLRITVNEIVQVYLSLKVEDNIGTTGKFIAGSRKLKGQKETRRTLENVVGNKDMPTEFGALIAEEVSHTEIKQIISSIVDTGANVQAGNVLRELKLAYRFCIGKFNSNGGYYLVEGSLNPCIQAIEYFKDQGTKLSSKPGQRTLQDKELIKFLAWLPKSKYTQISRDALMIVLLTGVRSGEAVAAKKEDFDLDKGTWYVVGKTEVYRYVQLSAQAINYIQPILENKENTTIYLLPNQNGVPQLQKKLSEQAWKMREDGDMLDIPRWTAHDLRRTVRTQLSRLKCPSIVGESVLGHSKKGMAGVYDLHEYESDCAIWLQKLANHYDTLGCTERKCLGV